MQILQDAYNMLEKYFNQEYYWLGYSSARN